MQKFITECTFKWKPYVEKGTQFIIIPSVQKSITECTFKWKPHVEKGTQFSITLLL